MTATAGTGNGYFNCLAVSLKAASAGTAPAAGIRIKRLTMQSPLQWSAGTFTIQLPTSGNLLCLIFEANDSEDITGISDGVNTWVKRNTAPDIALWHTENSTPNPNLVVTITFANSRAGRWSIFAVDIEGAAASPFVGFAGNSNVNLDLHTTWDDAPVLTPSYAPGLSFGHVTFGLGPATGFHTGIPAGAVFDLPTYDGETDSDFLTNAAGLGHLYYSTTAAQHWNWTIAYQTSNSGDSNAIAFRGA
jgi:hypothetical protein